MLRIFFTPADLGRVRLAVAPNPLWETVFAMYRMRDHHLDLSGAAWCRDAMRRRRMPAVNVLTNLVPGGYYPDFLTPAEAHQGIDAGLDVLAHTPSGRLRREVDLLLARRPGPPPSWLGDLRDGRSRAVAYIADAVRQVHDDVVTPWWSPASAQVHLDGRGLVLTPSYLSRRSCDAFHDSDLAPVLVYPVRHDPVLDLHGEPRRSVEQLIGPTRAAVLAAADGGRSTTAIAHSVGVSPAAASRHTTVLRDAGLIATLRDGRAVLHVVTPLGRSLLENGRSGS